MHNLNFKHKLFVSLFAITLSITLLLSLFFCYTSTHNLVNVQLKNAFHVSQNISSQIDNLYKSLELAATTISNSPALSSVIYELNTTEEIPSYDLLQLESIISQNLGSALFFLNYASNVMLFNGNKDYFYYTGIYIDNTDDLFKQADKVAYYNTLLSETDSFLILPPHDNPWSEDSYPVSSLIKKVHTSPTLENAIIEIQIPYSYLQNLFKEQSLESSYDVVILDENSNIIYPLDTQELSITSNDLNHIQEAIDKGTDSDFTDSHIYNASYSNYTHWRIVLIQDAKFIHNQIIYFISTTFILSSLILMTLAGLFMLILNRMTKPLNHLIEHINQVELDELDLRVFPNEFNEFILLNDAFDQIYLKLKESMNQLYEADLRKTSAQLAALQAQINPHFLYNTLNAISAASEVYGKHTTPIMCQQLAHMMRYITESTSDVFLTDEISHTKNYLELMRVPHEGLFSYTIDIPIELYTIKLPKLILQPIVENSFKHGFKEILPPWELHIKGEILPDDRWCLTFRDNGIGFTPHSLETLTTFLAHYHSHGSGNCIYHSSTSGLGLKNIFARLFIYFKNDFDIMLENVDEGCQIKLIGPNKLIKGDTYDKNTCS